MAGAWRYELRRLLLVLLAGGLLGGLAGEVWPGLFLGALGLLGWHWLELVRFQRLLRQRKPRLDREPGGFLGLLALQLLGWQKTQRKRRKRLRKLVARLQGAVEATPDGAVVLDDRGEILWLNRLAADWLGLHFERDVGHRITNLVRTPDFANYMLAGEFDEALALASPVDEMQHLLVRVVPYGKDRRLLLLRDVTRLHRLEEMRKDFVANVSHELRSPLTVLVGYLESLREDEVLDARWRRPLEQMAQQTSRMCLIVEDLLRLSRMESDPGGADKALVPVLELLTSIRDDAEDLSERRHTVTLSVEPELNLLGDYGELYSAFSNITFNAVQYTPAGGAIHIEWRRDGGAADAGGSLTVTDTGVGIDAHHLPRLTERFYRVDKARSRELGGTGLGLAIVKHVLARHNAKLVVHSVPGEGSSFRCVFPASRLSIAAAILPAPADAA